MSGADEAVAARLAAALKDLSDMGSERRAATLALAALRLGEWDRRPGPGCRSVLDRDGDRWTLRDNGKWGMGGGNGPGSARLSDLRRALGPLMEEGR